MFFMPRCAGIGAGGRMWGNPFGSESRASVPRGAATLSQKEGSPKAPLITRYIPNTLVTQLETGILVTQISP